MHSLDQLYQQIILDHAQARTGSGTIPDTATNSSHQVNPTCGDEVTLALSLGTDGTIDDLVWEGEGCSISQASLSMMCELVDGKTPAEIRALDEAFSTMMHSRGGDVDDDILDTLGDAASLQGTSQFPNRVKCALLGWMALRDALVHAEGETKEEK
ncbi:Fe-S cluster assembly sulfur transfer protein SufU [Nanchangia anserum]|uniref:SUF system NifU family Fe-S cluster assembly protein n=1 Tax=Nanchangia anserum TaxID=2692125 RepID=A0A8I0G9E5_9ACTO|nr:SUF system NifU family Fe-S cluster assembly protein [Nanchangia anserum]